MDILFDRKSHLIEIPNQDKKLTQSIQINTFLKYLERHGR